MLKLISFSVIFFSICTPLFAYLGPGVGGGVIMATIGIIAAIFVALFGLIWFPIKRMMKKKKIKEIKKKYKNKID